jgi:dephospho-CoA kinase
MKVIGLTGGIASGKSTAISALGELGAAVLDADAVAHELMQPGQVVWENVVAQFGPDILQPDQSIDRRKLGDIIFKQEDQRQLLNAISHPAILHVIEGEIDRIRKTSPEAVVFVEIPLLFEIGWEDRFDQVWTVWVDGETQLRRLMRRDALDEQSARERIAAQMNLDEKSRRSHRVIDNSGSREQTAAAMRKFYQAILP